MAGNRLLRASRSWECLAMKGMACSKWVGVATPSCQRSPNPSSSLPTAIKWLLRSR